MDYMHDQFPYAPQQPRPPVFYHPGPYPPYPQHPPQPLDDYYITYVHPECVDFIPHGPFQEEFDDVGEAPTRPRLTREQVGVLEAQFQANHKPNSVVKRQLAMQTNLSLARVANWFQNRRAKAKQQKKQEEFEITQSLGPNDSSKSAPPAENSTSVQHEDDLCFSDDEDFPPKACLTSGADEVLVGPPSDTSQDPGWASLQRALTAAKAAQSGQQGPAQPQMMTSMPPPEIQSSLPMSTSHVSMCSSTAMHMPQAQNFSRKHSWQDAWTSQHVFQDRGFNFGFEDHTAHALRPVHIGTSHVPQHPVQENGLVSAEVWQDAPPTPKGTQHNQLESGNVLQSSGFPMPMYPGSRRGSAADDLTNNLDAFAIASGSPRAITTPVVSALAGSDSEGPLNLAARRKRPHPAALTSAALRSRSSGAMTSMSPTFRPGMAPPAHTVRHVKSTGHSLNARYGIRKPVSAQRSPINVSTFAEAEALNRLMAQQVTAAQTPMATAVESSGPLLSPALVMNTQSPADPGTNPMAQEMDLASRCQLPTTQHLTLLTSPPTTPFSAEFDLHAPAAFAMPPVSAPPQYASFPDQTPPYSAGPLTNSSWPDAPLTSPDIPNFPSVTYIPSLGHPQKSESISGHFQEFMLATDNKTEMDMVNSVDQKKTDFLIQEFPNQKEEHAHVARQLAQHRPKNFVFANTAASDYDQS